MAAVKVARRRRVVDGETERGALFAAFGSRWERIDDTNAPKTGVNIGVHDAEFYWLCVTTLFGAGAPVGLVTMLHELLRPANARLSRVATSFGLSAAIIHAIEVVFLLGARAILRTYRYKLAFRSYDYNALADER